MRRAPKALTGLALGALGALAAACVGAGDDAGDGEVARLDIDLVGCPEDAQGMSVMVRVEGRDADGASCVADERCVNSLLGGASTEDLEDVLRAEAMPLFELGIDEVERITVAVSALGGCPLGLGLVTACGSAAVASADGDVLAVSLACDDGPTPACGALDACGE